jgi:hypothetical protein
MNQEQNSSRRDHLTLTTKEGKIELTEEQVSRITGGAVDSFIWFDAFMKIG